MKATDSLDLMFMFAFQTITTGRMSKVRSVKVLKAAGEEDVSYVYRKVFVFISPTLLINHESVEANRHTLVGDMLDYKLVQIGSASEYCVEEGRYAREEVDTQDNVYKKEV
jgi:hypothetical protein